MLRSIISCPGLRAMILSGLEREEPHLPPAPAGLMDPATAVVRCYYSIQSGREQHGAQDFVVHDLATCRTIAAIDGRSRLRQSLADHNP